MAVLVGDDKHLPEAAKLGGHARFLAHAIKNANFSGKKGEVLTLVNPEAKPNYYFLVGLGATKSITTLNVEEAGGTITAAALAAKLAHVDIVASLPKSVHLSAAQVAAHLGFGAKLRSYCFDKYRTKQKPEDKQKLKTANIISSAADAARKAYAPLDGLADSIFFARDLITEPPNVIYPASYAAECRALSKLGVKVEILGEAAMKKLGMGSLLCVGQGSTKESQLVVMQWYGGKKGAKPVALIGKGVCFDTGGISIKPANGMEDMKYDMAGSAAVVGTMRALAARKAKVNAIGVIGLVENMPDGNAVRPSDVVTSMSGQTVAVLNTDAEGRLVLADCLWYAQDRFKPACMVDLATLTGAIVVAIGSFSAGLMSNNDKLSEALTAAGQRTQEKLWRLPLGAEYDELINSDIADMQNISDGREAGSITAAQFLQRFVNDVPWAHLDIAGVAWAKKSSALTPKGAVGWGIRLLTDWIEKEYAK
jgi:leucyl aminopeptidase